MTTRKSLFVSDLAGVEPVFIEQHKTSKYCCAILRKIRAPGGSYKIALQCVQPDEIIFILLCLSLELIMFRQILLHRNNQLARVKTRQFGSDFLRGLGRSHGKKDGQAFGKRTEQQYKNNQSNNTQKFYSARHLSTLGFGILAATGLTYDPNTPQNFQMPYQPPQPQQPPFAPPPGPAQSVFTNWNEFCSQILAKGEVERILITPGSNLVHIILQDGALINGRRPFMREIFLQVPSTDLFEEKLRRFEKSIGIGPGDEVPIIYERTSALPGLIGALALLGVVYFLFKNTRVAGPKNIMSSFSKVKFTLVDPTTRAKGADSIKFKDVAGLKEAKTEIMEFVNYLKDSEKFLKLGAKLPKGVLLLGPPGCGKTLLAKAVATEANVPFLALSGSDFVEMIGGVGASRVRSLFKSAKKLAPCIIYIDEIDSIGKKRSGGQYFNGEMEQTLNQLLVEMDGMVTRKGVILLASTNRADVLDQALLRAGRFDRHIMIDLPTLEERREIFLQYANKIKLERPAEELASRIAQLTPGMSGADIANVCNEAALHAARKDRSFVAADDLEYAIERVVGGTEKRSSSITAAERRIIAYHESGHALVGWLLEHTDPILKVSIVPRTTNVLGFAQYLPSERFLHTPEQFFDRMCMALGGRAAELIQFNHLSTGAHDDLRRVTEMAMVQIKEYGFDSEIGNISFPKEESSDEPGAVKPYSKRLASLMDQRASVMVRKAFERTQDLISTNRDKLNLLATTLIDKEVMNSSDIEKLIGPRPYTKQ